MDEVSSLSTGINLVPQKTKKPQQVRHAIVVAVSVTRYILLGLGGVCLILLGYQSILSKQLAGKVQAMNQDIVYIKAQDEFQQDFQQLQTYMQELGTTHAQLDVQANTFALLEQITPQVITLTNLTFDLGEVRIAATTTEYPAIADYFVQLSQSDIFENVEIVNIARPDEEDGKAPIQFTISADRR